MGRPMVESILEVDKVATTIWQCKTSAFVGFLKLLLTWKSEFSSIRQYFWTVLCTVATLKLKLWKNVNNKNWFLKIETFQWKQDRRYSDSKARNGLKIKNWSKKNWYKKIGPKISIGIHTGGIHTGGIHTGGIHTGGIHTLGIHTDGIHTDGIQTETERNRKKLRVLRIL